MIHLDCKKYATDILESVRSTPYEGVVNPHLMIISTNDNPASQAYIKGKVKDCESVGITPWVCEAKTYQEALSLIFHGNTHPLVTGIIVELPLPNDWDEQRLLNEIYPWKDVDGLGEKSEFKPCTAEAIMYLLKKELGDLTGLDATVIGRGKLVGKPVAQMLLDADCTVTVVHSKTKFMFDHLSNADIIISAVGKPNTTDLCSCFNAEVIVDAGVSRNKDGKLVGDCYNFELSEEDDEAWLPAVTPVTNGIGLLTRAILMAHVKRVNVWEE
jgi:methylenetetrahydrofolate dehydrogenase (NADP+)/methenyltetrahydrofolate cyclohydrolase